MSQNQRASRTRSRSPVSRPTTPLRPSSRSSFRSSQNNGFTGPSALDALEPQFAELSDAMADLEANFMHLQLMHESLSRFGESFASFLYGLNMNAFVVDFPEVRFCFVFTRFDRGALADWRTRQAPIAESIKRYQRRQRDTEEESTIIQTSTSGASKTVDAETTFMTADTSFASMRATPRRKSIAPPPTTPGTTSSMSKGGALSTRGGGGIPPRGGRGVARGSRASSLPRGRGRGVR